MSMIVNKRHIILAALVLVLGVAVYLNWVYGGESLTLTEQLETGKNFGDAQLVATQTDPLLGEDLETAASAQSYFSEARLNRQKSRDSAIDALNAMFEDAAITDEQKAQLALQAAAVASAIETEGKIENLIKAKGFADCMIYIDGERVDAIVKTNGLLKEEVAQIKDILVTETGAAEENISITEVQ